MAKTKKNGETETMSAAGDADDRATEPGTSLATATHDELADVLGDEQLETDGLGAVEPEDIKIPAKVFNFRGTDSDGNPIPSNVFYDTISEETQSTVDAVLLDFVKSNEWREYDEGEARNKVMCRSFDRITGTMADGTERPCKGCPDARWTTDETGKRNRRCGPVHNIVGVERLTSSPFILRAKRTGLPPWQQYLNRYFIGRRVVSGKRMNYPLFAWVTHVALKMAEGKKPYAVPVFERGEVLAREEIISCAEQARFFREHILPVLERVSDSDQDDDTGAGGASGRGGDTSFDVDAMSDENDAAPAAQTEQAASGRF